MTVYRLLADAVVIMHLGFIAFVVTGGVLVLFRPRVAWVHVPCVIWGIVVEAAGYICPLTPLENRLRTLAGGQAYEGDFIIHCIEPVIYPEGLTREIQFVLAALVLVVNAAVYLVVYRRLRRGGQ